MAMSTNTKQNDDASFGSCFVKLFELDADQLQLTAHHPRTERDGEFLNRPYELSDLMRQATAAGLWPR
jgi:hypothetical protein